MKPKNDLPHFGKPRRAAGFLGFACLLASADCHAQTAAVPPSIPSDLPDFRWHLTARPWQPAEVNRSELLDSMEKVARGLSAFQYWNGANPADEKNGGIIDPYDRKEIQYGTPTYAFNVATLLTEGRVAELAESGARALDRGTHDMGTRFANDGHGEFFCAPLAKAIRMYEALQAKFPQSVTPERLATWKKHMTRPRDKFMYLRVRQNWRSFAMKGEWQRQRNGSISDAVGWIEKCWTVRNEGAQRDRFLDDRDKYHLNPAFFLYHDNWPNPPGSNDKSPTYSGADPQTFTYNGAVVSNLLDMIADGYDGPSAKEMREILSRAALSSLLLMSASGEAPAGGRTGEHCWDDTIYASAFQLMAEMEHKEGNKELAGQYRHAVNLLLKSHARFQHENGLFSVTKNLFPAALKNHYATWSGVANYVNFDLGCASEALLAGKTDIAERPTPSEIGGYVVQLDPTFSAVLLNAGGMQAQICTRGETDNYGKVQWHTLGITRFSRAGWDGRLGPGAGGVRNDFSDGVSFSPTFLEDGKWKRVCLEPTRFEGSFKAEFVHPLLTRGTLTIAPVTGKSGPSFAMHITLTPDGALVDTERVSGDNEFGVVWPLFEFDGRNTLSKEIGKSIASTRYPDASGKQSVKSAPAGSLEWTSLDGGPGGAATIGFRYTLAGDPPKTDPANKNVSPHGPRVTPGPDASAKLTINGVPQPDLTFLSTGSADFPHELHLPVTLKAGAENTIKLESPEAVVSEIRVHAANPSAKETDQQNFIALKDSHQLDASAPSVRAGYGEFEPVRVTDANGAVETFVYPRSAGDPSADAVRASFKRDGGDFSSVLGRVNGKLYVGRTSAGGEGKAIDLDGDDKDDVTFDKPCAFVLQLKDGKVTNIEADRAVSVTVGTKNLSLSPYAPSSLE